MNKAIKIDIYLYAAVSRFLDSGIKNRIENRNHKIAFTFMDKKILSIIILVMVIGLGISGLLVSQNILRRRSSKKSAPYTWVFKIVENETIIYFIKYFLELLVQKMSNPVESRLKMLLNRIILKKIFFLLVLKECWNGSLFQNFQNMNMQLWDCKKIMVTKLRNLGIH